MYNVTKRFFDICIAILVLLLAWPFLLIVMVILKFSGEGEVFYVQERIGYKNKVFKIFKFATMLKESGTIGTGSVTVRNDSRVTPVGRILRITKINELPQIFNVLLNDMSIVGPRPLIPKTVQRFPKKFQNTIYKSQPGITGITALILRDEEKVLSNHEGNVESFYYEVILPYKGELEIWYQSKKSTINDLKIVFLTGWVIFFPKSKLPFKVFKALPNPPKELKLTTD